MSSTESIDKHNILCVFINSNQLSKESIFAFSDEEFFSTTKHVSLQQ